METLRFRFIYGRIESNVDDDGNLDAILVAFQTVAVVYIYVYRVCYDCNFLPPL